MSINKDYLQYINSINIGSLVRKNVWLSSGLTSTKLMTQLKHRLFNDIEDKNCKDAFDVLYLILSRKYHILGKLVIIYIPHNESKIIQKTFDLSNRRITFTYLKNNGLSFLFQRKEQEAYKEIILSNGDKLKLWETPFELGAVTEYDKDFRKEWNNDWLAYEGNQYGDTSTFYIIGCIDN